MASWWVRYTGATRYLNFPSVDITMDTVTKATEAILVLIVGLMVGYLARRRGWLAETAATPLTRWLLAHVNPVVGVLALWTLPMRNLQAAALPAIYVIHTMLLWPATVAVAKVLGLDNREKASLIPPAMFSNQGFTYGVLVCYFAMGPEGLALAALYLLPFSALLYTVGIAAPSRYVSGSSRSPGGHLRQILAQPYQRNPILGVLAGLSLALLRIPQPYFLRPVLEVLMPLSALGLLFAIGLTIHVSKVRDYWDSVVAMHLLKYVVAPALGVGLAMLFGFWSQPDHTLLKVIIIQSATPSAITALSIVQALGLNTNLANSCWLTTNLVAIPLAGALIWLVRLL